MFVNLWPVGQILASLSPMRPKVGRPQPILVGFGPHLDFRGSCSPTQLSVGNCSALLRGVVLPANAAQPRRCKRSKGSTGRPRNTTIYGKSYYISRNCRAAGAPVTIVHARCREAGVAPGDGGTAEMQNTKPQSRMFESCGKACNMYPHEYAPPPRLTQIMDSVSMFAASVVPRTRRRPNLAYVGQPLANSGQVVAKVGQTSVKI